MMKRTLLSQFFLCASLAASVSAFSQERDVVVVGGALTEIVYALGAEKRIAATDTTSMYPPAALITPKVGYQRALNAEGLIAMKPTLLLATGEAGPPAAVAQIRAAGVKVEQMPVEHTMISVIDRVKRVAAALGTPKAGDALAAKLGADWDSVRVKVAAQPGPRPKVLFILAHASSTQVAGRDTAAHAMIEMAGGDNVMKVFTGYKPLTAESAVAQAPDLILITKQGLEAQGGVEGLLTKHGLALTPAGAKKRIVAMDALEMLGFGPRVPQTVLAMSEQFYKPR